MATHYWVGDSQPIAQVEDFQATAGTWSAGETAYLEINTKRVVYTVPIGGNSNDEVAAGLVAVVNGSTIPEFAELTAVDNSVVVTGNIVLTGLPDGTPFKISGGDTAAAASLTGPVVVTAPAGPNWWIAGNFNTRSLPVSGDTVIFRHGNVDCKYGIAGLPSVAFLELEQYADYTGQIGLPAWNPAGYAEYREKYLAPVWDADAVVLLGLSNGNGSSLIKLDMGTLAVAQITVRSTGASQNIAERAVMLAVGMGNAVPLHVTAGNVRVLARELEGAGSLSEVLIDRDADVVLEDNVVIAAGNHVISGGQLQSNSQVGTLSIINGGTFISTGLRVFGTLDLFNGTFVCSTTGANITTLEMGPNGVLDCSQAMAPVDIATATLVSGARIEDPVGAIAWGSPMRVKNGTLQSITYNTTNNVVLTVVSP